MSGSVIEWACRRGPTHCRKADHHICYLHKYNLIFTQIRSAKLDKYDFKLDGSVILWACMRGSYTLHWWKES